MSSAPICTLIGRKQKEPANGPPKLDLLKPRRLGSIESSTDIRVNAPQPVKLPLDQPAERHSHSTATVGEQPKLHDSIPASSTTKPGLPLSGWRNVTQISCGTSRTVPHCRARRYARDVITRLISCSGSGATAAFHFRAGRAHHGHPRAPRRREDEEGTTAEVSRERRPAVDVNRLAPQPAKLAQREELVGDSCQLHGGFPGRWWLPSRCAAAGTVGPPPTQAQGVDSKHDGPAPATARPGGWPF